VLLTTLIIKAKIFNYLEIVVRTDHQVNDHSGYCNVKPNGIGISYDFPVPFNSTCVAIVVSQQDGKQSDGRQKNMTNQDKIVNGSDGTFSTKGCTFGRGVVDDIGYQKNGTQSKGLGHSYCMLGDFAILDKIQSTQQSYCCGRVNYRIEMRQEINPIVRHIQLFRGEQKYCHQYRNDHGYKHYPDVTTFAAR